jgi:predicted DNA-binding transcriptional regulator AlpA
VAVSGDAAGLRLQIKRSDVMRIRTIRHREEDGHQITDRSTLVQGSPKAALTEAEAAGYIGMSAAWLKKSRTRRFRNVVDAPPFVRAGIKRVVYRREDLDAWQDRHLEQVGPTSERHSLSSNPSGMNDADDNEAGRP